MASSSSVRSDSMEPMSCRTSPAFLRGVMLAASSDLSAIATLELDLILMVPAFSLANGIPDSLSKLEFRFSWAECETMTRRRRPSHLEGDVWAPDFGSSPGLPESATRRAACTLVSALPVIKRLDLLHLLESLLTLSRAGDDLGYRSRSLCGDLQSGQGLPCSQLGTGVDEDRVVGRTLDVGVVVGTKHPVVWGVRRMTQTSRSSGEEPGRARVEVGLVQRELEWGHRGRQFRVWGGVQVAGRGRFPRQEWGGSAGGVAGGVERWEGGVREGVVGSRRGCVCLGVVLVVGGWGAGHRDRAPVSQVLQTTCGQHLVQLHQSIVIRAIRYTYVSDMLME